MSSEELVLLAEKVTAGTVTDQELALYIAACESLNKSFQKDPSSYRELDAYIPAMEVASLQRFWERKNKGVPKMLPLWKKLTTLAAAIAVITVGVYFLKFYPANQIRPGKNTATLTLANGKTIELSDSKTGVTIRGTNLLYNDGSAVSDDVVEAVEMTAATPKGGTYQFTLPDGSKVWLNADSKITFPSQFSGEERQVWLEGEAYFAVAHLDKQPFKVFSKGQVVEDVGTEFNINAYSDEPNVRTTLVAGLASVSASNAVEKAFMLKPGQQAKLQGHVIKISRVNIDAEVAWQKGEFVFDDESIGSIMRKICRWYNVGVVYQGVNPEETFGGSVSRFSEVSKVLENLELTGEIHFKIKDKIIYVFP